MSCHTCSSGGPAGISVGSEETVTELTRVVGIEEANRLLAEGYFFVSMYFNQAEQQEVYILARLKAGQKQKNPIGFCRL
ncbi:hypothetical protein [Desulforamulus hydrothermalis]|uniref:Uncharacterized protein n=1 Tax=Desulforamulus hydrothermalis Lam5 = DSM 18033 TaxID=1121428 RepID=K8E0B5_9FIRM|nr:hypothetical protein [Desulforamulus hydrothermalis]CCO08984.1 conserved hypothetical protein [Desulforamulus hydrothermalis Lam5 = DSM 18033]SHG76268.1 hypothetical protein SAMN02745177_00300 [Desulforamulus hydrothermalis Lam5 = DSM 18033]